MVMRAKQPFQEPAQRSDKQYNREALRTYLGYFEALS
jgi:hypothetical protein